MIAAWIIVGLALVVAFVLNLYSCLIIAARDVNDNELFEEEVDSNGIETEGVPG